MENNIRPPDPIKKETLLTNNIWYNNEDDDNINVILEISKREYYKQQKLNRMKEQEEQEQRMKEQEERMKREEMLQQRKNKLNTIKTKINKMLLIDKENKQKYEFILSIIELYEIGEIHNYKINLEEYTTIINLLKTVRLPIDEVEYFKKLIQP